MNPANKEYTRLGKEASRHIKSWCAKREVKMWEFVTVAVLNYAQQNGVISEKLFIKEMEDKMKYAI